MHHDVGWLNVPMHHLVFVSVLQTQRCLTHDFTGQFRRNATESVGNSVDLIAVDVLHHHEVDSSDATSIHRPDNMLTVQFRRRADLTAKSRHQSFVRFQLTRHDLHGDVLVDVGRACSKHMSHAATTDGIQQSILLKHESRPTLKQLPRLPASQVLLIDQSFDKTFRRDRITNQLLSERRQLRFRQQLTCCQRVDESGNAWFGHTNGGCIPSGTSPSCHVICRTDAASAFCSQPMLVFLAEFGYPDGRWLSCAHELTEPRAAAGENSCPEDVLQPVVEFFLNGKRTFCQMPTARWAGFS